MIDLDDTIVAVSTASGVGRRGIVRLSGPHAFSLLQAMCSVDGLADLPPYSRLAAELTLADGTRLPADLYLMRAPRSYTREDVAEIHTFGSPVLLEMVVDDLLARGARMAQAGEFTRRAFLNGRIDLAQAEAVLQVIRSRTDSELRLALRQLDGRFSRQITQVRERLVEICSLAEVAIDFSDQDIEIVDASALARAIDEARSMIVHLAEQAGQRTVGRPGIARRGGGPSAAPE